MADAKRTITCQSTKAGRQFIEYSDGTKMTRKIDLKTGKPLTDWREVEPPVSTEDEALGLHLSVVVQNQSLNEPKHWSLFCHRPNSQGAGKGQVWQVKGDAEFMHYKHALNVDILRSATLFWHEVVNDNLSDSQYDRVIHITKTEPAPRAANRAAVTENCQGWVIRVLTRLAKEGIVQESAVSRLEGHKDPIN